MRQQREASYRGKTALIAEAEPGDEGDTIIIIMRSEVGDEEKVRIGNK